MRVTNRDLEQLVSQIRIILRAHKVTKAALFGSYVRGDNRRDSDLDILVKLPKGDSLFDYISLKQRLEDVLRRRVDLVEYSAIKPLIRESVFSNQLPII